MMKTPSFANEILNQLKIYCPRRFSPSPRFAKEPCQWSGEWESLVDHVMNHCKHTRFLCPNGCLKTEPELNDHNVNEDDASAMHVDVFDDNVVEQQLVVKQQNRNTHSTTGLGDTIITQRLFLRQDLKEHLEKSCPHQKHSPCRRNRGHNRHGTRARQIIHRNRNCRRASCPNRCGIVETFMPDEMQRHLFVCPLQRISCPNRCGVTNIQRNLMHIHIFEHCDLSVIACPLNCGQWNTRMDTQRHLETSCPRNYQHLDRGRATTSSNGPTIFTANDTPSREHYPSVPEEPAESRHKSTSVDHRFRNLRISTSQNDNTNQETAFNDQRHHHQEMELNCACVQGRLDDVKAMLRQRGHPGLMSTSSQPYGLPSPLISAVKYRHHHIVTLLLQHDASDAHMCRRDENGHTALMHACGNGCQDLTRILLELNASATHLHCVDNNGFNVLMIAVYRNHVNIVRLLLEYDHSVRFVCHQNDSGVNALGLAEHNQDLVEMLQPIYRCKRSKSNGNETNAAHGEVCQS